MGIQQRVDIGYIDFMFKSKSFTYFTNFYKFFHQATKGNDKVISN